MSSNTAVNNIVFSALLLASALIATPAAADNTDAGDVMVNAIPITWGTANLAGHVLGVAELGLGDRMSDKALSWSRGVNATTSVLNTTIGFVLIAADPQKSECETGGGGSECEFYGLPRTVGTIMVVGGITHGIWAVRAHKRLRRPRAPKPALAASRPSLRDVSLTPVVGPGPITAGMSLQGRF